MNQVLTPLETETVEQDREHLEVVVLLVTYYVNHLVDREVLEAEIGSTDVLSHINRSSVRTEQEFLVETLVGEVSPNRVIILAEEETLLQSFLYLLLTLEISV